MRIDAPAQVMNQAKVSDVPRLQPRQAGEVVETDRDDNSKLASARMEASRTETRKIENEAGLGNTIDTTA